MTLGTCVFLIDTGADISLIKNNKINIQHPTYTQKCTIHGVTSSTAESSLATISKLYINHNVINHNFQIVDSSFPIPGDGILGRDFLIKFKCILDYNNWTLTINTNQNINMLPVCSGPEENSFVLPAWSEATREITLSNNFDQSLIHDQQISPGIFVKRSIVKGSKVLVTFLNTNSSNIILQNINLKTDDLNNYHIYGIENDNTNRISQLLQQLDNKFPSFVAKDLSELCKEFSDVFALKSDFLTHNNFYEQTLHTSDNQPVYTKNYRIPHSQKAEINAQVTKMYKNDIIEPSVSSYNSPVLLVPKKSVSGDKKWRLVIDFRQVNKKIIADRYPLPRIDDILDQLGRAKWFSVLDLMSGFHQVPLEENSRDITSFTVDSGTFRFKRLPFGLSVSPNSFQRMMNIAFASLSPEKAFMYMDDLIVTGCSEKHHLNNLKAVFELCRKHCLKLNPEKCQFFRTDVTYLGHRLTDQGILPDESKFEIIKNYPRPDNADAVKRFVAFCNYYRKFIKNFAEKTISLNKLTRKNTNFVWTDECEKSFQNLKQSLMHPPILQYPQFDKPFIITTDAAKLACGGILSQIHNGHDLPIAYASRAFTKGEINKSTIEKELSAIHWAIMHFRPYIFGQKFSVRSDHRPLVYLFSMKDPSSKLTRMRLDLEEFDFTIEYIQGKNNVGADALSRIDLEQLKETQICQAHLAAMQTRSMRRNNNLAITTYNKLGTTTTNLKVYEVLKNSEAFSFPKLVFKITNHNTLDIKVEKCHKKGLHINVVISENVLKEKFALAQIFSQLETVAKDNGINNIQLELNNKIFEYISLLKFKETGNTKLHNLKILLTKPIQIITGKEKQQALIAEFHENPIFGGHCGQKRLLAKLKAYYFWKNMKKHISQFVKKCPQCQLNKSKIQNSEPFTITPTPFKAFDIVIIDTVGPLPRSLSGNAYLVTIECDLTKYLVAVPIPNKEAKTLASAIFENFILVYGPMKEIRTDMGTEYVNETIEEITKLFQIKHCTSTPYRPQTVGTVERIHRVINEYLRSYVNDNKSDWDEWTKYFTYCYNTTPSTVHKYCPFELIFAKNPILPNEFTELRVNPLYNIDSYAKEVQYRLQMALCRANAYLQQNKAKQKTVFDASAKPLCISVGDWVVVRNEARHKLDPVYKGPFKVLDIVEPNCIIRDNKGKSCLVHKNRLSQYNI